MTYEEAVDTLREDVTEHCSDCDGINKLECDSKCDSLIALDIVSKPQKVWDEVLIQLSCEAEANRFTGHIGTADGLERAIRIIERKLKEVKENV